MKAVIFAGGVGTRLWPLSRKNSPKQFEKIVDNKSTLQLTVDRLLPHMTHQDIYISTGKRYVELIQKQLPQIPAENIIAEPEKKDVGPAVGLAMGFLNKKFPKEPVIILWSDHLIKKEDEFVEVLKTAESIIKEEPEKIVFIGHRPRFASENLGWIEYGEEIKKENNTPVYEFVSFKYKPDADLAQRFYQSGKHAWNLGYWVTTPRFMYSLFERFAPEIYALVEKIVENLDDDSYEDILNDNYMKMPVMHFDHAILEKMDPSVAYVMSIDIGWTDIGAWEALKNALEQDSSDCVIHGKVLLEQCTDSLVYNYQSDKLIVGMDLDDFVVINTEDVLLVTKKSSVPKITKLVESLQGTEHEKLT